MSEEPIADVIEALRAYLLDQAAVTALAGDRIFGIELPAGQAQGQPRKALVLRASGGVSPVGGYAEHTGQRIDAFSYGETPFEAARLDRAVFPALKQLRRQLAAGVLVHWVEDAGGYSSFRDPDTRWPAVFRSYQAFFAEGAIAA